MSTVFTFPIYRSQIAVSGGFGISLSECAC